MEQGSPHRWMGRDVPRCQVDGHPLVNLTSYKAANIENEYSGAELAV